MEAAKAVKFDFPVELQDVYTQHGKLIKGAKSVVRTDNDQPLSVVKSRYDLFTHSQMYDAANDFLHHFGDQTQTKAIERDGLRFVMTSTFPKEKIKVENRKVGDIVNLRISFINTYDGTSSRIVKIGGMVLRCLNGMTIPGGELELSFPHLKNSELKFPDPDSVLELFRGAGNVWRTWADRDVNEEAKEAILDSALKFQVVAKKTIKDHSDVLDPNLGCQPQTFWSYYNNFTNVLTHKLTKIQDTKRLGRLDRLNAIFCQVTGIHHDKKLLLEETPA